MIPGNNNEVTETRRLSAELLHRILEKGAFANISLERELSGKALVSADKNLVTEIVSGTVRMHKHLDWVLDLFLPSGIMAVNPWLRTILRMSAYQIMFTDRIPAYAAINEAVSLTRQKTNKSLSRVTNGVLRNLLRQQDQIRYPEEAVSYLAVYYSHPEWIVDLLLDTWGPGVTEEVLKYNNAAPRLILRNNQLQGSREDLIKSLREENIDCSINSRTPWGVTVNRLNMSLENTRAFEQGLFYVQNEASMLAAAILQVDPGHKVYDLCSGVGGKTTHLAEMMQNHGEIWAYELYGKKVQLLKNNYDRLGINIIKTFNQDVLLMDKDSQKADRVLLDAPCSGLGVIQRRADLRWRQTPETIRQLVSLQGDLLDKAGQLVEKGGLLLYSTCTVNEEENIGTVTKFLDQNSGYSLEGFNHLIRYFALDGVDDRNAARGTLTIIPGKYQTDGMFYALMRRKF